MDFSDALKKVMTGTKITRDAWNNTDKYLEVQNTNPGKEDGVPYLFVRLNSGKFTPWGPSPADLMATDWSTV
jgi:hypothetical protein